MHSGAHTGNDSMEPDHPVTKSATPSRTTTTKQSSVVGQEPHLGEACSTSIPSPDSIPCSTTSSTKECPGQLSQCGVSGTTARSHFSLSRFKQNKHCAKEVGAKAVHHHVLQPKPTIHHVRHALGKARRARANVLDKDNDNKASMQYSVNSEDSEDRGGPQ